MSLRASQGGAGVVPRRSWPPCRAYGSSRMPRSGSGCRRDPVCVPAPRRSASTPFARTRRYTLFRQSQLVCRLLLPFALQWSLGGFENSRCVPLGDHLTDGGLVSWEARQAVPGFWRSSLVVLFGRDRSGPSFRSARHPAGGLIAFFALNVVGVADDGVRGTQYFVRAANERDHLARQHAALSSIRPSPSVLLLNVLTEPIAARLKEHGGSSLDDLPRSRPLRGHRGLHAAVPALAGVGWCRC